MAGLQTAPHYAVPIVIVLCLLLTACTGWSTVIEVPDDTSVTISRATFRELDAFASEDGSLLLERVLYATGYRVIETLHVTDTDGAGRLML